MGVMVFSTEPGADGATVYSRMFAAPLGIAEDAATGSAAGPLGCYLVRHDVVSAQEAGSMLHLQGVAMGRPSYIRVAIGTSNGDIISVRVGGESVVAGEGTLFV
jgi:trans-2,3-dihydro-3-hydroxyanthranilate isomerase